MTVVGASSVLSAINRGDHALMHRVNHWFAPDWIQIAMTTASRCGDGWLWCALGFIILLFGDSSRFAAVGSAMLATFVGLSIYQIVKKTTRRTRPCLVEPHSWSPILPPDQFSFPSGHTIAGFSIAVSVGLFYPSLLVLLLVCATLIAVSRIMLGMHFLSDVLVGAMLGTFLGYRSFLLFQRLITN
jgi:undecaprenyl-diphosphatase